MNGLRWLIVVVFGLAWPAWGVAQTTRPAARGEPKRLTAYVHLSVTPPQGASKAAEGFIARTAAEALPKERFAAITVGDQESLTEARAAALKTDADVFLHLTFAPPKVVRFKQAVGRGPFVLPPGGWRPGMRRGPGRRGGDPPEITVYTVRTPLALEMSVRIGTRWRLARTSHLTSAEVPGAETDEFNAPEELTKAWGAAVRLMTPAACERALLLHFLPNITVHAIECEPLSPKKAPRPADGGGSADAPDVPQTLVKMKLTNRSHSRVEDATVTVERYVEAPQRWVAVDAPRGLAAWLRRHGRRRRDDTTLIWPVPALVDPGQTAFSEERPVGEDIYQAMKRRKCRIVLHATPVVWSLTPSRTPHRLEKTPDPKP